MNEHISSALTPDLQSELLQLWKKFLDRNDLTVDDDFFESGGDSLLAEELLVEVEKLTQTTVPPSLLFEAGTVRQLANRLSRDEAGLPQPAVKIGGNEGRLFHFFHGDFTHGGVSARRLTAPLGPERPTLAIAPHGMRGEQVPATIEQMAADRLPVIQEAQPQGPYVLGGHCAGALVAFETARLLINAGQRVDLVVMVDPIVVSLRRSARLFLFANEVKQKIAGVPTEARSRSRETNWEWLMDLECQWRKRLDALTTHIRNATGRKERRLPAEKRPKPFRVPDPEVNAAYARAILNYHPSSLDVPILYLALKHSGVGWRRMSPKIEFINAPGVDHQLRGESGANLMRIVQKRLDTIEVV